MADMDTDSLETEHLLEQFQAGDRAAFERLLARHQPSLRKFIAGRLDRRIRARLDLSDVVQETELEAHRRMGDFMTRRPMPFHVWLRLCCRKTRSVNCLINFNPSAIARFAKWPGSPVLARRVGRHCP
jgi:hypothetical protein